MPAPETDRRPFTDAEIARLWEIQDKPWVDSVLVFRYTGFRISELLGLKKADVDLEAGTLKGGIKTSAGKNRIVPIHSRILPFIRKRMAEPGEYLFSFEGRKLSQTKYYDFWDEIMEQTGMQHTPHECRHTLRSRLDSAEANKVCIPQHSFYIFDTLVL